MKSNVEKEFNAIYKEAGKKRSRSLQGTYWGISDVIEYFESKNILYTYIEGENEITIHIYICFCSKSIMNSDFIFTFYISI